jgi:hypothetical protein
MKYNIPDHISGDTWDGISAITLRYDNNSPINLNGVIIKMQIRTDYNVASPCFLELTNENEEIVIIDPENGIIGILPLVIDIPTGNYCYSLHITFPDDSEKTYLMGKWNILPAITRKKVISPKYIGLTTKFIYFGTDSIFNTEPMVSDDVKNLSNIQTIQYTANKIKILVPINSKIVCIAYPNDINDIKYIDYLDFGSMDILDVFTKKIINFEVPQQNGTLIVPYKVYYYIPTVAYQSESMYEIGL